MSYQPTKTEKLVQRIRYTFGKEDHKNLIDPEIKNLGHGYIEIVYEGRLMRVYGGSFLRSPLLGTHIYRVCLAEEITDLKYEHKLPISDFSTPTLRDLVLSLDTVFNHTDGYDEIYAGCMGGYGRTGLFISAMVMVCQTEPNAALAREAVRGTIHPYCVETQSQFNLLCELEDYLRDMPFSDVVTAFK